MSTAPGLRAVFLDVDDTLVDYHYAARSSFHATLGVDADYGLFTSLEHYERFLNGSLSFQAMRETRMRDYLALVGRADDPVVLEAQRFAGLADFYRLFDDALPCIAALRERDLLLGLITNNESVHQRAKLRMVGLDGLFDAVVISGDLDVAKPDARIFTHACALLGVAPHEAMHVGDNITADAAGARAAGLRAVWLDRSGERDASMPGLDVIHGLDEVALLVDGHRGAAARATQRQHICSQPGSTSRRG